MYIYICMYGTYVIPYISMIYLSGALRLGMRSTAKMAWVQGMGKRSRAYFLLHVVHL